MLLADAAAAFIVILLPNFSFLKYDNPYMDLSSFNLWLYMRKKELIEVLSDLFLLSLIFDFVFRLRTEFIRLKFC